MSDAILDIMNRYAGFSLSGDGHPEIEQLRYLSFETPAEQPPTFGRLVLVLVEPRLLLPIAGQTTNDDLLRRLERFKGDLRAEGLYSRFIEAQVYAGSIHKDGATLLAMRRFVREVRQSFARLEGLILVGSFPESSLVRRWIWASPHPYGAPLNWTKAEPHLTIAPEPVSTRTEIVLADLDGNWEQLYHRQISIPAILAMPDAATQAITWQTNGIMKDCVFGSNEFMTGNVSYNDCFYVDDANYTVEVSQPGANPPYLRVRVRTTQRNPEVAAEDRNYPNVLARPDICVSRLNARNIAYDPDPSLVGDDGQGFLDGAGRPRTFASSKALVGGNQTAMFTAANALLERRLLNRYFDRNHRYRVGAWSKLPFRPAVISGTSDFKAANYLNVLSPAATDFGTAVLVDDASPVDYVNFMKTPAPLKYVIAHSNPWNSAFDGAYQAAALEAAVGGPAYRWKYENQTYTPSFAEQGGAIDWFVHRSLFHSGVLEGTGASLVIHGGCDVNSVAGTHSTVYGERGYGGWQNAESMLFGSNTVALLSRAKTFNDAPWGMCEGLRTNTRANFGAAWRGYYNAQASDAALAPVIVQNKRAYFWSMIGDWTLRLRNKNGLGLIGLSRGDLRADAVQPNQAWIDGWNLDSARDFVAGHGDFDGDGRDELVLTSDWGMAIVGHDGTRWRQSVIAARDTWFGAWRWDARVNKTRDVVRGVANFAGTAAAELLVTSSWGLGVLRKSGTSMQATRAYQSGTRIGGWVYDASNNRIMACADLDGDGHQEVVVFSPWGAGALTMHGNRHIAMHPTGERLGGWVLDISNNVIRAVGDFDGDHRDELLVTSPWGIGILEYDGAGKLRSQALYAWGTDLGLGCVIGKADVFMGCGDLCGRGRKELLLRRSDGLYVLAFDAGRLRAISKLAHGTRVGGWLFDASNNRILRTGLLAGNGREQAMIISPWGIGVLGFDAAGNVGCLDLQPFEAMLGDWYLQSTDVWVGCGNFSGSGTRHELLVSKRRP